MKTVLMNENKFKEAAEIIKQGGTVVFRTETVYGLGADATNEDAVKKIFKAKNRPAVNPLIIHYSSLKHLLNDFGAIDPKSLEVIKKIRHAITIILPKPDFIPHITTGGLDTVAVRIPACKFARKFIRACGVPLAAPSANSSTRPSPTHWVDACEDLEGKVDAILCGRATKIGVESTVIKVKENKIEVLRLGGINTQDITKKTKLPTTYNPTHESPGTRFKHYSPSCPLIIAENADDYPGSIFLSNKDFGNNAAEITRNFFHIIRATEKNAEIIVVQPFPNTPEFQTINERLDKASTKGV